uniref:Cytochrome P450 n=1 Tax=Acrobeloides nanus TaxID=290746 RepID=A0A914C0M8_9BILA
MHRKRFAGIPSPRSYPILGHVPITKPDVEGFVDQIMGMASLYPDEPRMVTFWAGPMPSVMLYSAELAEVIYTSSKHLNKGMFYDFLLPWLGEGLVTSKSEKWRPRRKLLTPTFHYDILKNFVYVFNHQSEILVNKLNEHIKTNEVVEIGSFVTLCALDIICETSMGQSVNAQTLKDSEYVRAVYRINDIVQRRQKYPLMWNDTLFWLFGDGKEHKWAINVLHSFTRKVIMDRKTRLHEEGSAGLGRLAFLDLLLDMEKNGDIDLGDIQEEVDTFMFEGHDTTATGITFVLHMLGCYPEIQEKAYAELQTICGTSEEITFEHLGQLKYLECVIKETLRLHPSVPIYARRMEEDDKIGGFTIPAGTQILVNAFLIHRDPKHWPDPEIFRPERFMLESNNRRHPFAFVPFSAGSRNCIGQRFAIMEEKIVVAWVLRNFKIVSLKRRDETRLKTELILRPIEGVRLQLTPRPK